MDQQKIQKLELTQKAIDDLAAEIQEGQYTAAVLEDFKESVDHARTTIWTMMKVEQGRGVAGSGQEFELGHKLVELRLRRAHKLLQQIQSDIDIAEIEIHTPGIAEFRAVLTSLFDRLNRLIVTGG